MKYLFGLLIVLSAGCSVNQTPVSPYDGQYTGSYTSLPSSGELRFRIDKSKVIGVAFDESHQVYGSLSGEIAKTGEMTAKVREDAYSGWVKIETGAFEADLQNWTGFLKIEARRID